MIRPFELHRPTTVADAAALLKELPEAAVYRGGTELLQVMKLGLAAFRHLIDLKRIPALHGITRTADGSLRIGAGTPHHDIERSPEVRAGWPALAELERRVANRRVRSVGSIGGNLCFAEPHSDPATLLLAADARLELWSSEGTRSLAIDAFILDALETDLRPGELLTAVVVPAMPGGAAGSYRRIALAERPTVSVACRIRAEDGIVSDARISLGSIGDRPTLVPDAAAVLIGAPVAGIEGAARKAASIVASTGDVLEEPGASAEYRRHLAGVVARRAIIAAGEAVHA